LNFSEIYENATGGACGPRAVTVGEVKFSGEISGQKWLILVDVRAWILMAVVSTSFDG
jgi:hypothetical protein